MEARGTHTSVSQEVVIVEHLVVPGLATIVADHGEVVVVGDERRRRAGEEFFCGVPQTFRDSGSFIRGDYVS